MFSSRIWQRFARDLFDFPKKRKTRLATRYLSHLSAKELDALGIDYIEFDEACRSKQTQPRSNFMKIAGAFHRFRKRDLSPVSPGDALDFAAGWERYWNERDLDGLLAHFSENVVFTSTTAKRIGASSDGRIVGKDALRRYWSEALQQIPDLRFTVSGVFVGIGVIVLISQDENGSSWCDILTITEGKVCMGYGTTLVLRAI